MDAAVLSVIIAVTGLALFFDYTNGRNDSSSIVAAMVSSGAMSLRQALVIAATFEFLGAYFLGTAVAKTVGQGIVEARAITAGTVAAALVGAIVWNYVAWYFGIPSSSSHALIGGLLGAVLIAGGRAPIHWLTVGVIYAVLIASPLIGFSVSYVFTKSQLVLFHRARPSRANVVFSRLQVFSSIALALSHGTNDAQKTMGIITLMLVLAYPLAPSSVGMFYTPDPLDAFVIPQWVIVSCAGVLAFGIATGGFRILRTLGGGLYRIRPIHAFTSLTSAAAIIYGASLLGFPLSTSQVSSSSILGAGSAQRANAIRWGVVRHMAITWLVTIPASGAIAAACQPLLQSFMLVKS